MARRGEVRCGAASFSADGPRPEIRGENFDCTWAFQLEKALYIYLSIFTCSGGLVTPATSRSGQSHSLQSLTCPELCGVFADHDEVELQPGICNETSAHRIAAVREQLSRGVCVGDSSVRSPHQLCGQRHLGARRPVLARSRRPLVRAAVQATAGPEGWPSPCATKRGRCPPATAARRQGTRAFGVLTVNMKSYKDWPY